jgi:nucleotidyltransferase/DNA polymerase involved in DNA repair
MPSVTAKRQCPDLIFVKPRFEAYKAVSQQIRKREFGMTCQLGRLSVADCACRRRLTVRSPQAMDLFKRMRKMSGVETCHLK